MQQQQISADQQLSMAFEIIGRLMFENHLANHNIQVLQKAVAATSGDAKIDLDKE